MMLRIGLIACMLLLTACMRPQSFSVLDTAGVQSHSEYTDTREADFLKKNPKLAKRRGDTLTLHLPNGLTRSYEDVTLERCERETPMVVRDGVQYQEIGSCVIYFRVIGYWPEKSWFLIEESYYEGADTLVVNSKNDQISIGGLPVISPKNLKMFTYDAGCGMDAAYVAIWDVTGNMPHKVYGSGLSGRASGDGEIHDIRWDGENRLAMTVSGCEHQATRTMMMLERKNGAWIWSGKDPYPDTVPKQ